MGLNCRSATALSVLLTGVLALTRCTTKTERTEDQMSHHSRKTVVVEVWPMRQAVCEPIDALHYSAVIATWMAGAGQSHRP